MNKVHSKTRAARRWKSSGGQAGTCYVIGRDGKRVTLREHRAAQRAKAATDEREAA